MEFVEQDGSRTVRYWSNWGWISDRASARRYPSRERASRVSVPRPQGLSQIPYSEEVS
jgi:hypothetical protein